MVEGGNVEMEAEAPERGDEALDGLRRCGRFDFFYKIPILYRTERNILQLNMMAAKVRVLLLCCTVQGRVKGKGEEGKQKFPEVYCQMMTVG